MKTLAKIVGALVVCLVVALGALRATGFEPTGDVPGPGNYPGLWLRGDVVTTPVTDWSFVTQYKTDKVQTRTWYMIPHSVTTGHLLHDGKLYITSNFGAGVPFPDGKSWVKNVMHDPHVRLKFGNNLYDCVLSHVDDPDERAAVLGPRGKPASAGGPVLHIFRVMPE